MNARDHSSAARTSRKQPRLGGASSGAGLRAIACFEAGKGLLVLLLGFGLLSLIHREVDALAEHLVTSWHLNPDHRPARVFLEVAERLSNTRLWVVVAGSAVYSLVRFVEA